MEFFDDEYDTERKAYSILSTWPMKGCPSLIESVMDPSRNIYALVLEKTGPSLEDLCNLLSPMRFDEEMTLAVAIQMVRVFPPTSCSKVAVISYFFDKLDRYADLHARKIIHNGVKPANICLAPRSSNPNSAGASTLNLINFGYSFFCNNTRLVRGCGGGHRKNNRFTSILSYHGFSEFFIIYVTLPFINSGIPI